MRRPVVAFLLAVACLTVPALVAAQSNPTLTVTNVNDSGAGSLRWAIGMANQTAGADLIVFDPQVFVAGGSTIVLTTGPLTLTDTTGATTIDAHGVLVSVTNVSRAFTVSYAVTATISGLSMTGGQAVDAGSNYQAGNGGAIYNSGHLIVTGCSLHGNSASHEGGAIYNDSAGHLTVSGSSVFGNSANFGAGIGSRGVLTVDGSSISYNSSTQSGGGIGNAAGVAKVNASTLSYNSAAGSGSGGGIHTTGPLTVSGSTLSNNAGANSGGGIAALRGGSTSVISSTVSANVAAFGGGIDTWDELTVNESTIALNSATSGGGISTSATLLPVLTNTLVARNFYINLPSRPLDLDGTFAPTSSYNLVGDGTGGLDPSLGNLLGTPAIPLNPNLGLLQDNGGPTPTHALLAGSPAVNAGDPAILPGPTLYDQRGPAFVRVVGGRIDIGAFEVQPVTSQEHLANLADAARALLTEGAVPPGVGKSIAAKVDAARALLEGGNTTAVIKMLEAFIEQVGGLRRAGKLTKVEAEYLINAAQRAIESIEA